MKEYKHGFNDGSSNVKKHLTKNPLKRYFLNRFFSLFIELYRSLSPQKVVEVGCGEGFILHRILSFSSNASLFGTDISQEAIQIASHFNPSIPLFVGDINQLPFKENAFDLVICSEVLEHLTQPSLALKELCRISSRHLLLSVPNEPYFHLANFLTFNHLKNFGHPHDHYQRWSKNQFKNFISKEATPLEVYSPFPWTVITGKVK